MRFFRRCLTFFCFAAVISVAMDHYVEAKLSSDTIKAGIEKISESVDIPDDMKSVSEHIKKVEQMISKTEKPDKLKGLTAVKVKRVVDGDTFVIDNDQKVRLIGIDTPESVASDEYLEKTGKKNTDWGKYASNYTKSLIEGKTVYLEFDAAREDKYGRLLAYVYLEDGRMLQDVLLMSGYADLMTIQPNVKYADHFVVVLNNTQNNN